MSNVYKISRKEFEDLLRSPMLLIILSGFFIMIIVSFIVLNRMVPVVQATGIGNRLEHVDNFGLFFDDWLFLNLVGLYGPIIGIMVGCSSIASERHNNALNTLLVKPVYKDTVITGKIMGMMVFLALVVAFAMVFYTSLLFVFYGNLLVPVIGDYVSRLPGIFIFAMVMIAVFVTISMLASIVIRNQAFALVVSMISLYIFDNMETNNFAGVISNLFPGKELVVQNFIASLTPAGFLMSIRDSLFDSSRDAVGSLSSAMPDLAKFLLYVIILCVAAFIVFVRRDET